MKAASRIFSIAIVLFLFPLLCAGIAGCTKDEKVPETGDTGTVPETVSMSIPDSVIHPAIVSDEADGVIVVYGELVSDDKQMVHVKRIGPAGDILWDTMLGTAYTYNEDNVDIVSDDSGGAVVHLRLSPPDRVSLPEDTITKINAEGDILWQTTIANNNRIEKLCPDGNGSVFILFSNTNSRNNCQVQRLSDKGDFRWDDTVLLRRDDYQTGTSRMIPDGSGGAIVTWIELDNGPRIRGQRIDAEGELLWEGQSIIKNGKVLYTSSQAINGQQSVIIPDGDGGVLLNWIGRSEITVFHTDQSGEPVWTMNVDVKQSGEYPGYEHFPCIFRDLSGDIRFFWSDVTTIYTQKLDDTGALVSPGSGIVLWEDPLNARLDVDVMPDRSGGIYVAWNFMEITGSTQEKQLRLMRFDAGNDPALLDDGIVIDTPEDIYASFGDMTAGDDNSVFFTWATGPIEPSSLGLNRFCGKDTFIQRYSADGEPLWGPEGIQLNP